MSLGIGLHYDVAPEVYHSDPCATPSLSASVAKVIIEESPAHAWLRHPRLGGQPLDPTADMDRGTLIHALLLGAGRSVVMVDAPDWRTNKAKEERDFARKNGAIPVLKHKLEDAHEAAERIRERLRKEWLIDLSKRKSEVVAVWEELARDGSRVLCRGQMDSLLIDEQAAEVQIVDLKITGCAAPASIERNMVSMGYDIQRAAYESAIERLKPEFRGRVDFAFLFCEPEAPYAVTPVKAYGSLRELGERRWQRAVDTWARCQRDNEWPTYTTRIVMAEAKPWELEREVCAAQ